MDFSLSRRRRYSASDDQEWIFHLAWKQNCAKALAIKRSTPAWSAWSESGATFARKTPSEFCISTQIAFNVFLNTLMLILKGSENARALHQVPVGDIFEEEKRNSREEWNQPIHTPAVDSFVHRYTETPSLTTWRCPKARRWQAGWNALITPCTHAWYHTLTWCACRTHQSMSHVNRNIYSPTRLSSLRHRARAEDRHGASLQRANVIYQINRTNNKGYYSKNLRARRVLWR